MRLNCQEKDYWELLFDGIGLWHDIETETKLINAMKERYHMGWFVQNLLVFRKKQ